MNDSKDRLAPATRLKTLALLLAGITASWQAQAQAQAQNTERLDRVEVTGSNIKRLSSEGLQSVQVITAADIQRQGVANAGELLDRVASNGAGKIAESNTNTFTPGAAGASLRGLGANATLVLLNGRRVAYYGFVSTSTFVDLYSIPWSAIERVEILKEGASAIKNLWLSGGLSNVGAARPPFELNDAGNGFNYYDNPHGRRVWLRASYAFK